ncbi:hypothetical protein HN51_067546 [Arachis hypogaea]|uniref:uncharacterized protein LOC107638110 isoform X1 n=1 Tax=Arachis ipaensis TaxID=130454 RepID=UPI0007AEF9E7|nr:uncharacterized protein LOC107638110 isoform X1 [Arachis ipaensis]XP_020977601.1 uncharacterized protein LOC107638110 isoform X1 [Arachis ipaensis]XP_025649727.1 uncharacterized protein LOC112744347 isoform X1 [Arachis hypogaea]XP_025649728.1 uncharacterized protein LOC112744347 isoform X1 [Arachis hypogaea]QHO08984.1 uncharacterized protein DS421_14g477380 [Arachis hypogaea]
MNMNSDPEKELPTVDFFSRNDIEILLPMHDGASSSSSSTNSRNEMCGNKKNIEMPIFFPRRCINILLARASGENNRENKNILPVSDWDLKNFRPARPKIANISPRGRSYLLLGLLVFSVTQVAALNNNSPLGNLSSHSVLNFWEAFWMLFPAMIFFIIFIFCAIAILVLVSTKGSEERFAYSTLLSFLAILCCITIFSQSSDSVVQWASFRFPLPLFVIFEALALLLTCLVLLMSIIYLACLCKQRQKMKE